MVNFRRARESQLTPGRAPDREWRTYAILGWIALVSGLGLFIVWAVSAPIDKGVPIVGTVAVVGQRLSVQAPTPGLVDKVLVKEGQHVSAGQLLLRIQSPQSEAIMDAALASYTLVTLTKERLVAELGNRPDIMLPHELRRYSGLPGIQIQLSTQRQLLRDRMAARNAEFSSLGAAINGLKMQQTAYDDSLRFRLQELTLLEGQAERVRTLVARGFASSAALDDMELKRARARSDIAEIQGQLNRISAQITETQLNLDRRVAEYRQETKARLLEATRDFETYRSQLNSAEINVSHTEVKSPATGAILGLMVTNSGAVVSTGEQLLNVVPDQRGLSVEAQVPVHLIDQLQVGQPVELMFSAFQRNKTPRLTGNVLSIGADRLTDKRTALPYFPVNISINKEDAGNLGNNEIRPGMPVDVFIRTGERTFASYLLKPILDRFQSAITEE